MRLPIRVRSLRGCRFYSCARPAEDHSFREGNAVLLRETIAALNVKPGQTYADLTFGTGGHSRILLERGARVVAIDRDPAVEPLAAKLKEEFGNNFNFRLAKFTDIRNVLSESEIRTGSLAGVLIDCGVSSLQLEQPRGFSLKNLDAPLDMRMDPTDQETPTAAKIVNTLGEESLSRILKVYGAEKNARRIADSIVAYRYEMKKLRTVGELCKVVETAFAGDHFRTDVIGTRLSLSLKTLTALRIFVNDELNQLNRALSLAYDVLAEGGAAAVISTNALEDRIVKKHFSGVDMNEPTSQSLAQKYRNAAGWHEPSELEARWTPISNESIVASDDQCEQNQTSKNTKLRAAIKH